MTIDIRSEAAKYYDLHKLPIDDIPFYIDRIPSQKANILELGCGTGRVLVPLTRYCNYIHGLDISETMLKICRDKLKGQNIPQTKVYVEIADITDFDLGREFDLIIAAYRVFQNLETDEQINGLFRCIRKHLAANGTCILNVFNPFDVPEKLAEMWAGSEEYFLWEKCVENEKITCHEKRRKIRMDPLTIYTDLIYRKYKNDKLIEEKFLNITMRCYYPQELEKIITEHSFKILNRWGGYNGELYGQGNELVIEFCDNK